MKNLPRLTTFVVATQIIGCEPEEPSFPYTHIGSDNCVIEITPDYDKILWEKEGTVTKLTATLSYLEGGKQESLELPPNATSGTISALPRDTLNPSIDPTINIHIEGVNEEDKTICEKTASMTAPSIELPATFAAVHGETQSYINNSKLTDETVKALNGKIAVRTTNGAASQEDLTSANIILEDPLISGLIYQVFGIEDGYGFTMTTGADIQNGKMYAATEYFPGLVYSEIFQFDIGTGELEAIHDTENTKETGFHHGLFVTPQQSENELTIHSLGWITDEGEEFSEVASSEIITVDSDTMEVLDTQIIFDPRLVSQGSHMYGNSTTIGPVGPNGTQYRTDTYPIDIKLRHENDDWLTNPFVVATPIEADSPTIIITKNIDEALTNDYKEHYPELTAIEVPNNPNNGNEAMSYLHNAQVWTKTSSETNIATYNLYEGSDDWSTVDIYSINLETDEIATFICSYQTPFSGGTHGNIVMPTHDSSLMGILISNPKGDTSCTGPTYWIDTETCELVASNESNIRECGDNTIEQNWRTLNSTDELQDQNDVHSRTTQYNIEILQELGLLQDL